MTPSIHRLLAVVCATAATSAVASANTFTTLGSFDDLTTGWGPFGGVVESGGMLYGTAGYGGANDKGTVFSIPLTGGAINTLVTFNGTNGARPKDGLTVSGGKLYGTTSDGGTNTSILGFPSGVGTVFSVDIANNAFQTLTSFDYYNNGGIPAAGVIVVGNTLYGTTSQGGQSGTASASGTVFSLSTSGGSPVTLHTFNSLGGGADPESGLTLVGNRVYGSTVSGGPSNFGTIYSVSTAGDAPTTLATFNQTNGAYAYGGLTLVGDTLYGTTSFGGENNRGTIFSVPLTGGPVTVLASFDGTNGENPNGDLTLVGDRLYGTTTGGGFEGNGTIFSIPLTGGLLTTEVLFDYDNNGAYPEAGLLLIGNTLYGTTYSGGANAGGTVFSLVVPEPASLSLLALGAAAMLRRRSRSAR